MDPTRLKVRSALTGQRTSGKIATYQQLIVGRSGWGRLLRYELANFCSFIPGALGLALRGRLYPGLLGRAGRNVVFGTNVVLRHPHKITIGDNVVIDDNVLIDAKGSGNTGIAIGSGVYVGRNSILSCKDGDIRLGDGVNIGFNCEIYSSGAVWVGDNTLLAAYCYLIGGAGYDVDASIPFAAQELRPGTGLRVGSNCWLGAGVTVMDGVTIGDDSVIGAGAVVIDAVAPGSVAMGVPATVRRARQPLSA
ncbi:MAG: hypothetical protein KBD01_08995 [Acidobacteria bacterium]|nr:hypothetical protein [Acidobacteriota bacterium]